MNPETEATLRPIREVVREEMLMHRPIWAALSQGPLTIPEIARTIGRPSREVVIWAMGMRRYGLLVELPDPTDEGYFRYAAQPQEGSA